MTETEAASEGAKPDILPVLVDVFAIAGLHVLLCVIARASGFDHVSDDDFARVTIAEAFAHAPKLDPSGTSWLPFPFWLLGGSLAVVGRSLSAARVLSIAFASAAAALPYVALRSSSTTRASRLPALLTTVFAFSTPWSIWLGASTVPESMTASLTAAGVIGLTVAPIDEVLSRPRRSVLFALCVMAACLSRYEPWPVALVVAVALAMRARSAKKRGLAAAIIAVCILGPLLWMAWNAYAHDGPLHFFRRVSNFKRAIGEGSTDTLSALLMYPRLLLTTRPEVVLVTAALIVAMFSKKVLREWTIPLLAAGAQVAFLAYGNARDGAPAHHPERALVGTLSLLAIFAANGIFTRAATRRTSWTAAMCIALTFLLTLARATSPTLMPAKSASEDRTTQIARGQGLKTHDPARVTVTPCEFEHFATIAAFGKPEAVTINAPTHDPITDECPKVDLDH